MKVKTMVLLAVGMANTISASADSYGPDQWGQTWLYSVTKGTSVKLTNVVDKTLPFDAANIPWTFTKDGVGYTITGLGTYSFLNWSKLTGTLSIPDAVTAIDEAAFRSTGLNRIASFGGVSTLSYQTFMITSLSGVIRLNESITVNSRDLFATTQIEALFAPGPKTGTKSIYAAGIARKTPLKVFYIGENLTLNKTKMTDYPPLYGVSGCKVFLPANGYWDDFVPGGTDNEIIYYGASTNLNLVVDEVAKTITATPADETALVKVLEVAPTLKSVLGWNTHVNFTNIVEAAAGTITKEMLDNVEFNTMCLTFKVKSQSELDNVLATVPESAHLLLAIDPSDAKEALAFPQGREVFVRLSSDGKQGKYQPKILGLRISFR